MKIKSNIGILAIGILLVITIIVTIMHNPKGPGEIKTGTSHNMLPHSLSVKVFIVDELGWGYEIYIDTTLFIYQDVIPCVSGINRFKSQDDASKCGKLVVEKIRKNKMPSISLAELDSLQVKF